MNIFFGTLFLLATQFSVAAGEQTKTVKPSTFDYIAASAFEIVPIKNRKKLLKVMNGPSALDELPE